MRHIRKVEYSSAIKKNDILLRTAVWMQLENITLRERRCRGYDSTCVKCLEMTSLYRWKTDLWLPVIGRVRVAIDCKQTQRKFDTDNILTYNCKINTNSKIFTYKLISVLHTSFKLLLFLEKYSLFTLCCKFSLNFASFLTC